MSLILNVTDKNVQSTVTNERRTHGSSQKCACMQMNQSGRVAIQSREWVLHVRTDLQFKLNSWAKQFTNEFIMRGDLRSHDEFHRIKFCTSRCWDDRFLDAGFDVCGDCINVQHGDFNIVLWEKGYCVLDQGVDHPNNRLPHNHVQLEPQRN